MKKHLFTVLLATVAVGGVFAMNANKSTVAVLAEYQEATCTPATAPDGCVPNGATQCTIIGQPSELAFDRGSECLTPLGFN